MNSGVEYFSENSAERCKDYNMCCYKDDDRIMKCSRITLRDRKEHSPKELEKQHHQRQCQPQLHNYLSWLNKPHTIHDLEQPSLTICNLVLPKNASVFVDRGARSEKWTQKRPRLQSGKTPRIFRKPFETVDLTRDVKVSQQEDEDDDQEEKDSQCMEIQQIIEEYEIDENVQRLIQEAAEYDQKMEEQLVKQQEMDDEISKRRQRKCSRHSLQDTVEVRDRPKSRITRTVTLSLSRAPSPETIQVIRVDVTSNYSLEEIETSVRMHQEEEEEEQSEEEYAVVNRMECNRRGVGKSLINHEPGELTLHCQKLALADRMPSNCH